MIKSLVDLKETLRFVAEYIPADKQRKQLKAKVDVLIVNMSQRGGYAEKLEEGIMIIRQVLAETKNKALPRREKNSLDLLLVKWEIKRKDLSKNGRPKGVIQIIIYRLNLLLVKWKVKPKNLSKDNQPKEVLNVIISRYF